MTVLSSVIFIDNCDVEQSAFWVDSLVLQVGLDGLINAQYAHIDCFVNIENRD